MPRRRQMVLVGTLIVVAAIGAVQFWSSRAYAPANSREADCGPDLADKINPNYANWASLARLPGIGPKRARTIIAWREQHRLQNKNDGAVFLRAEDLAQVKGIGLATVQKISPYLIFDNP